MNLRRKRLSWLMVLVVLFSVTGELGLAGRLEGRVKKSAYHSPAGNFTVEVPKGDMLGGKTKVEDSYNKDVQAGAVSMGDAFGRDSILYMRTPPSFADALEASASTTDVLEDWLREVAMPTWFLPVSPESKLVMNDEPAVLDGADAVVALVEIPQGSAAKDVTTGKRLLSRRGIIVFYRRPYIYAITTETAGLLQASAAPKWPAFVEMLESFYGTITFTPVDEKPGR